MLRPLAVLLLLFITGAPIALCVARTRIEWTRLVFEGIAFGLVTQLLLAFVLERSDHFTRLGFAVATLVVVGTGVVACRWFAVRAWPELDRWWSVAVIALTAVGLLLRMHPTYFIFELGDMGEYINGANKVAQGIPIYESFPHAFTLFLASTNVMLGRAHTVDGLSALGIILLLGALVLPKTLGLRTGAVLLTGVIVVVNPVMVWFSTFPVSETLYSVLVIIAFYFLVRARAECSFGYAALSALAIGALLLVRGNALLLVPILVIALGASAAADRAAVYRVQRFFTVVALLSLSASYAYDVRYVHRYFVETQLRRLMPGIGFRFARHLHLLDVTWSLVAAVGVFLGVVLLGAHAIRALLANRLQPTPAWWWRSWYVVVVVGTLIAIVIAGSGGLSDALIRWGLVLLGLALVGLVVLIVRPDHYVDGVSGLVLLLGVATYSVLFAYRLPHARSAPYYLYWDRYLFSEVLPFAVFSVAIASDFIFEFFERITRPATRRAVAVVAPIVIVLALLPDVGETRKVTRYTVFGDAYSTLETIDRVTRIDGKKPPIVYSGLSTMPAGWDSPETYRAFALPLQESFRRRVFGVSFDTRHLDPHFDPQSARDLLARKHHLSEGFLVALREPGASPYPDDAKTRHVATIDYRAPLISRHVDRSQEHFDVVPMQLDVYALSDR